MRVLFRLFSFLALVAAILLATVDAIQSVAAGATVFVRFADVLTGLDPALATRLAAWPGSMAGAFGESGANLGSASVQWAAGPPGAAVMLAMALVFWIIGYRRPARFSGLPAA